LFGSVFFVWLFTLFEFNYIGIRTILLTCLSFFYREKEGKSSLCWLQAWQLSSSLTPRHFQLKTPNSLRSNRVVFFTLKTSLRSALQMPCHI